MNTTHTQVLDCGHEPTPTTGCGTGTAHKTDDDGETWSMCYDCAYIELMDDIVLTGIEIQGKTEWRLPTVYMSSDGKTVTTWDGQFIGHVTYHGETHVFGTRYRDGRKNRHHIDVKITYGADVVNAYGTGAPGEYCALRRRKSDVSGVA